MGTNKKSDGIGAALFGKTRRAVLGLLYSRPDQTFYMREIVRRARIGFGAVQRELGQLLRGGLIARQVRGRQVYYQANRQCPVFSELRGLVMKTVGLADVIRAALSPMKKKIVLACLYGSAARGQECAGSDVDVLVVGKVSFGDVVAALNPAQDTLGREVNPLVYSEGEFRNKMLSGHRFLRSVMLEPKIVLLGNEREFTGLAEKRLAGRGRNQPRRNRQSPCRRRS